MFKLKKLDLMLFDGDGGGAAGPAGTSAAQGESGVSDGNPGAQQTVVAARKGKQNPLANVKYGIQPEEAADMTENTVETAVKEEAPPAQKASFDDLIKGEYKKDFDSKVQSIINQRFKEQKTLKESADKAAPIMDFLSKRFGKEVGDYDGLYNALMNEQSLFEAQALREGKSTEEVQRAWREDLDRSKMKRENDQLRAELQSRERMAADMEQARRLREDAERVKQFYGNFDLSEEMKNPKFVGFLRAGVDMKGAYEATHMDELMRGALHYTAQKVSEQVVNSVKANAARPAENGTAARASSVSKTDVSKLTRADRAEISRRVARGEKISFG